jgi:hypothetical protein
VSAISSTVVETPRAKRHAAAASPDGPAPTMMAPVSRAVLVGARRGAGHRSGGPAQAAGGLRSHCTAPSYATSRPGTAGSWQPPGLIWLRHRRICSGSGDHQLPSVAALAANVARVHPVEPRLGCHAAGSGRGFVCPPADLAEGSHADAADLGTERVSRRRTGRRERGRC